ncbi:ABC transporter ATP-binding protein [Dongia sp.]|uniref:ABC transporter ATP-binding protein n=1 Tax=Dongia sp. TaxID=1977262 RepID=UPI0035B2A956
MNVMTDIAEISQPEAEGGYAVLARALVKQYAAHRAVDGIELSIPAGKSVALIGHNGAGKTTLMKLILGLTRPSSGKLQVLGGAPADAGLGQRRHIGFLPENVAFHDELTGTQTLSFYARLKGVPLSECGRLIERVGLAFAAGRRVKTYSKGMRQRLGLAQALLGDPRLLLLDEPTTGLDPRSRGEFFAIVDELSGRGATVIISSHILTELEAKTDLVAIMNGGRMAAFGPLERLRMQANLPVRFAITCREGPEPLLDALQMPDVRTEISCDGRGIDLWCPVGDKMKMLSRLVGLGPAVADIDIRHPGLDEIYRYFSPQPQDLSEGDA